jgi:8-oxo-dGTP pyrophosphatase MutT (NUDIX family)
MCAGGAHHPSTSTFGVSAGAVNPHVATAHTGAGFYIIDKHGWLAGAGASNIWQSFGGRRKHSESPWQTASREMLEETGISSDDLVSLAPPFYVRKDAHVYVLHVATFRSTCNVSPTPSRELARFKHFKSFADNFDSELSGGDIVHRRDIEPAFLTVAAEVYRAISMRAQAAAGASPRRDSGDSASAIISSGQQPAAASLDPFSPQPNEPASDASLCDLYPNLHASNFVEHSTASRLHARLVSHRVHVPQRKRPVAIDARGQLQISKGLRKCDTPARRTRLSDKQARDTLIRRRTGHANHGLAGLPNDPPAQPAAPTDPVQFVPRKANEFASDAEPQSLMTGEEEWPPDDDDSAVDARQPPNEIARTSPPLGTSSLATPFLVVGSSGRTHPCEFFGPHPSVSSSGH